MVSRLKLCIANLSLRQIVLVGACLGIMVPACLFGYIQLVARYQDDLKTRIETPMLLYSDMMQKGLGVSIWNVNKIIAQELINTVMTNEDVLSVVIVDDTNQVFLEKYNKDIASTDIVQTKKDISFNNKYMGTVTLTMSKTNIWNKFLWTQLQWLLSIAIQVGSSLLLIWLLFEYRIVKPIYKLREASNALAHGNLTTPITLNQKDEIGSLAISMDTMRKELSSVLSEREQLNATLEQKVRDRTKELQSTLDQLNATQAELIRNEKLSALGSLVAGVSHELNTPIGNSLTIASTIQDNIRDFKKDVATGLSKRRLDDFIEHTEQGTEILMSGLRSAAELITSFKQVAVDQTSMNRRTFNVHTTINEVLVSLAPSIRKFKHQIQNNIPVEVTMDSYPGPLGQVITNLINNALIHAFEKRTDGQLTLSGSLDIPGYIILSVQDNGIGIPEEHLGKLFDPFFTTKLGKGGSGLGLHIVYNVVTKSLGGRISVQSEVGVGTVFLIMLPLQHLWLRLKLEREC